jgi:hypothetical protein
MKLEKFENMSKQKQIVFYTLSGHCQMMSYCLNYKLLYIEIG